MPKSELLAATAVIDAAVESGELFVGGARWRDAWVMRISVISNETTIADGDSATRTILAAWNRFREGDLGQQLPENALDPS